jgi:hypothetical protein
MATRRLKRPRDPIQLGKLIVDIAAGQVEDRVEDDRDPKAVERGSLGGVRGGRARAEGMPAAERRRIAKRAAKTRWAKTKEPSS